jgi:hypothetical protein
MHLQVKDGGLEMKSAWHSPNRVKTRAGSGEMIGGLVKVPACVHIQFLCSLTFRFVGQLIPRIRRYCKVFLTVYFQSLKQKDP